STARPAGPRPDAACPGTTTRPSEAAGRPPTTARAAGEPGRRMPAAAGRAPGTQQPATPAAAGCNRPGFWSPRPWSPRDRSSRPWGRSPVVLAVDEQQERPGVGVGGTRRRSGEGTAGHLQVDPVAGIVTTERGECAAEQAT